MPEFPCFRSLWVLGNNLPFNSSRSQKKYGIYKSSFGEPMISAENYHKMALLTTENPFVREGHKFCKTILRLALQTSQAFSLPKGFLCPHDSLKRTDFSQTQWKPVSVWHCSMGPLVLMLSSSYTVGSLLVLSPFLARLVYLEATLFLLLCLPQLFWANQSAQLSRSSNKTCLLPIKAIKNIF